MEGCRGAKDVWLIVFMTAICLNWNKGAGIGLRADNAEYHFGAVRKWRKTLMLLNTFEPNWILRKREWLYPQWVKYALSTPHWSDNYPKLSLILQRNPWFLTVWAKQFKQTCCLFPSLTWLNWEQKNKDVFKSTGAQRTGRISQEETGNMLTSKMREWFKRKTLGY